MSKKKQKHINIPNKKVGFEYHLLERYDAGMVLKGTEIKAIREAKVSFSDSFCAFIGDELYIRNLSIAEYSHGTYANHNPTADRKLLLHKKELLKLKEKVKEKGLSIIPVRIYTNENNIAKIEIALAKGKKLYDKRQSIKEREQKRNLNREKY